MLAGREKERDYSWLDLSSSVGLPADGKMLLMDESEQAGGESAATYLRRIEDSLPVQLGQGEAAALSPDGKWALSFLSGSPAKILVQPTGVGQPKEIINEDIASY